MDVYDDGAQMIKKKDDPYRVPKNYPESREPNFHQPIELGSNGNHLRSLERDSKNSEYDRARYRDVIINYSSRGV